MLAPQRKRDGNLISVEFDILLIIPQLACHHVVAEVFLQPHDDGALVAP